MKAGLVLGTMTIGEQVFEEDARLFLKECAEEKIYELDTAYVYNNGQSEMILGKTLRDMDCNSFKVSTKINPRISGRLDGEAAYHQLNESLKRLGLDKVDTVYLHFPDKKTPVEDVLRACDELYRENKFKELGLSNFPAWLVSEVYYKCKENGWIRPTVYEGLYNPLSRFAEMEIFPAIRNFNMRYYSYNPLAGGILTDKYSNYEKTPEKGRFTFRPNYKDRYWHQSYFEAVNTIRKSCEKEGISIVEGTYRWMTYHSCLDGAYGDSIIIGSSRLGQLKENISYTKKGQLSNEVLEAFEKAWRITMADAPQPYKFYEG